MVQIKKAFGLHINQKIKTTIEQYFVYIMKSWYVHVYTVRALGCLCSLEVSDNQMHGHHGLCQCSYIYTYIHIIWMKAYREICKYLIRMKLHFNKLEIII